MKKPNLKDLRNFPLDDEEKPRRRRNPEQAFNEMEADAETARLNDRNRHKRKLKPVTEEINLDNEHLIDDEPKKKKSIKKVPLKKLKDLAEEFPAKKSRRNRKDEEEEDVGEPIEMNVGQSPDLTGIDLDADGDVETVGEELQVAPKTKKKVVSDDDEVEEVHQGSQHHQMQALPVINVDTEDEGMTVDEALAKVSMLLAKTENPKVLSEINEAEIRYASALFVVAEKMEDHMLASFLQNFLLLRVSKSRKGRSELLDIARASRDVPEQKMSRLRNLFQGLR